MKKHNYKFLIITFLFITSISLIGWDGVFNLSNDTINLTQINEGDYLRPDDSLITSNDLANDFIESGNQNLPDSSITKWQPLKSDYVIPEMPKLSIESVQYTSFDPITITGNNDPLWQNFTGRGTAESPYLIQDFEIIANTTLIFIQDTTVHFDILNNRLNGTSGLFQGILLVNVTNGEVKSNVILHTSYGVRLYNSNANNVTSNGVYNSTYNGIYLLQSNDNLVDYNTVYNNSHGIGLTDSWNTVIEGNWAEDNRGQGIALYNSSFVDVIGNNLVTNNQKGIFDSLSVNNTYVSNNARFNGNDGIYGYNSNNTKIISNYALNNSWNGIVSQGNSNGLYISENSAFNNTNVGLRLEGLSSSTIETNYIYQNLEQGIWLDHSQNNIIRNNDVDKNHLEGIYLEGGSDDNTIQENTLYENKQGIRVDASTNCIIDLNTIDSSNAQGILVITAENIEISNNLIIKSWGSGMWLSDITIGIIRDNELYENVRASLESTELGGAAITAAFFGGNISGNQISFNYYWGIFSMNSGEHDISHNYVTNNSETGIVLQNTNGTTVNNNEFAGNFGNGMLLNNSNFNQILYNAIYQNLANGITIINSNSNYIHDNDIHDNMGLTNAFPIRYSQVSKEGIESIVILDQIMYSIKGTTSGHGIFLDPSFGNTIEFNNIYGNSGSGAYLYEASNTQFNENVLTENGENGVFLENSNDNTLNNNIIIGNGGSLLTRGFDAGSIKFSIQGTTSGHGIFLDPSMGNTIKGNEISHNVVNGISLFESNLTYIEGNTITKNGNGIYLEDSRNNNITQNTIAKNGEFSAEDKLSSDIKYSITGTTSGHGIFLDPSDWNAIHKNAIFGNENYGIYVMDSDFVLIESNSISVNRLYGVFIDLNSDYSEIKFNDFNYNNFGSQVSDDGQHDDGQVRDDGEHGDCNGNYWSDLIGDIYYLDGLAENSDENPADAPYFPPGYEFTPPTVIYPNGGETLSGTISIQWNIPSNEKYPDEISYYVFYSGDAGTEWLIIPFGQIGINVDPTGLKFLSIEWDTKTVVDGSKFLIQVVAVDKVGSLVSDISDDVFQIGNGIDTTDTTEPRTTDTTTPSITPAWTLIGALLSIGSYGWIRGRKKSE